MTASSETWSQNITSQEKLKTERHSLLRQQQKWGWIFLSPWIFGFFAFTLIPIAASVIFSFTNFNLLHPEAIRYVGLDNFHQLTVDPRVKTSLWATLKFAVIALPLSIVLPLGLASLLNSKDLLGKRFFRTLFYMPYMVPVVSGVYIWAGVLNPETGWINRILETFVGIRGPDWLNSRIWIYPALNIIGLWGIGNAMLFTLASMQGVPTEMYEAARVDGAGRWRSFRHITLPMISPVIFYNLVLSAIGLWKYFEIPFILKKGSGDPAGTTMFFNIHLYKTAFLYHEMGYAAALAWLLFALSFGTTVILFLTARYWVYYAAGEEF